MNIGRGAEDRRCDVYARATRSRYAAIFQRSAERARCASLFVAYRPSRKYERGLRKRQRAQWRNDAGQMSRAPFTFSRERRLAIPSSHCLASNVASAASFGMYLPVRVRFQIVEMPRIATNMYVPLAAWVPLKSALNIEMPWRLEIALSQLKRKQWESSQTNSHSRITISIKKIIQSHV